MKSNTFMKFLESTHPLKEVTHHNSQYDFNVYSTSLCLYREHITTNDPLGDPENRKRFNDKCIEYVMSKPHQKIQEYLFYDTTYEQGMVMTYRPDSLRKGSWCLAIITKLPFKRQVILPKHPTKKAVLERVIKLSQMPIEALQYVLQVVDIDNKLQRACEHIESKVWDASVFSGNYGLEVTIEKDGVKHISSKLAHRNLKLVEI